MSHRRYRFSGATLVAFLAFVAVMAGAARCVPRPPGGNGPTPTDLNTVAICATPDGAAPGQAYPCVWEEAHEEDRPYPGIRWVWYVREYCPGLAALPAQRDQGVKCIDVREWETDRDSGRSAGA